MVSYVLEVIAHLTKMVVEQNDIEHNLFVLNLQLKKDADTFHNLEQKLEVSDGHKIMLVIAGTMAYHLPFCLELIRRWKSLGADCVMGGPVVNGGLAEMLDGIPDGAPCIGKIIDELKLLMDEGCILYRGDAYPTKSPSVWETVIEDVIAGTTKPLYDGGWASLESAPIPDWKNQKGYLLPAISIDQQSGCPFFKKGDGCQFCCIGSLSGKMFRERNVTDVLEYLDKTLDKAPKDTQIFSLGDNGSRSPTCLEFLQGLAVLQEKYQFNTSLQADTQCHKLPDFLGACEAAGVGWLFIGVETPDKEALLNLHKFQNNPEEYKTLCDTLWDHQIVPIGSVMVGLPHHTTKKIYDEVEILCQDGFWPIFTVLSPSPGSPAHASDRMHGKVVGFGQLSMSDSSQVVTDHTYMSRHELQEAYWRCCRQSNRLRYAIPRLRRISSWSLWKTNLGMAMGFWRASRAKVHPLMIGRTKCFDEYDRKPGLLQVRGLKLKTRMKEAWLAIRTVGYLIVLMVTTVPILRKKQ